MRPEALSFWQSRNRYKSSEIALSIADRYARLELPVGVLVIDYKNQVHDGDFAPNPACYPSVKALADGVREAQRDDGLLVLAGGAQGSRRVRCSTRRAV